MTIKLKSLLFVSDAPAKPKHAAWLAPLPGHGFPPHLHAVTGLDRRAQGLPVTLGVNVRLTGLDSGLASIDLARLPPPGPTSANALRRPAH